MSVRFIRVVPSVASRSPLPYWFVFYAGPPMAAYDRRYHVGWRAERDLIHAWCADQFGPYRAPPDWDDYVRWEPHPTMICFADALDATAFKLRWC